MKQSGSLARRYAKALFMIGQERNILDRLRKDMTLFANALTENQDFFYFFDSPEVTRQKKEQKISEIFGDSVSDVFYHFLLVVLQKRRQSLFLEIAVAFQNEIDIHNNRVKAVVTSPVELTPEMQKEIGDKLSQQLQKKVILIPEVDESLIGGIRITIDGKVIDGSIKGQLHRLRQYLLQQSAEVLN